MSWDPKWDEMFTSRDWGSFPNESLIRAFSRSIRQNSPEPSVLELGCGTGANIPLFAKYYCKYTGIDASPAALAKCSSLLSSYNINHRSHLVQADLYDFDVASLNSIFDYVIDIECLYSISFERAYQLISGSHNCLKPGGTFISLMFSNGTDLNSLKSFKGVSTRSIDEVNKLFERFSTVNIELTSRTFDNMSRSIEEFVVVAIK